MCWHWLRKEIRLHKQEKKKEEGRREKEHNEKEKEERREKKKEEERQRRAKLDEEEKQRKREEIEKQGKRDREGSSIFVITIEFERVVRKTQEKKEKVAPVSLKLESRRMVLRSLRKKRKK